MIAASAALSNCNRPTRQAREMRARSQFQLARIKRVSASAVLDGFPHPLRRAVLASYSDPRAGLHSSSRVTALVQQGVVLLFTLVQLPGATASGAFSGV